LTSYTEEVKPMSASDELPAGFEIDSLSIEELARLQGVTPITSLDDLACPGLFDPDEEMEEFVACTDEPRRRGST
jgi:hypothetical protein